MGTTPEVIANNLSFLQIDLTDAEFHRHGLAASAGMRAGIRALVRDGDRRRRARQVRRRPAGVGAACDAERIAAQLGGASRRRDGDGDRADLAPCSRVTADGRPDALKPRARPAQP